MMAAGTSEWLVALGRVSAEAGVLVLLVLLVQTLLRKQLPPRWRCSLWLLVVARLLLPVSFASVVSIFNLVPPLPTPGAAAPTPDRTVSLPGRKSPLDSTTLASAQVLPDSTHVSSALGNVAPNGGASPQSPVTQPRAEEMATQSASATHAHRIPWMRFLFAIWLGGVFLLGAYVLIGSIRLARRLAGLPAVADDKLLEELRECRRLLGVRSRLIVVESSEIATPALHGLLRLRLLLPRGFARAFSPAELRFVLLHELAHVKRRDIPLNWLIAVLQVLHWFNPLLWLGFARWRADRELACDALALEAAGPGQNKEYGRTILRLLEGFTHRVAAPGLVGILEDKRRLRQRIRMIASFRPNKRWRFASAVLLAVLGLVCLTDAQAPNASGQTAARKTDTNQADTKGSSTTNALPEVRVGADPAPTLFGTNIPAKTIRITVLDEQGRPLAGADIEAPYLGGWQTSKLRRLTDQQGRFVLKVPLPPKRVVSRMSNFSVSAEHEGFARRSLMWTSSAGNVYAGLPEKATLRLEKGVPIGGRVEDGRGTPLKGVRVLLRASGYRGFTMGNSERRTHQYSEVWLTDKSHPAATTDASGRWSFEHFPSDLTSTELRFVRPDGSQEVFATEEGNALEHRPILSFAGLRAQTAVARLEDGVTVRGIVVNESGRPLPGVTVEGGYGYANKVRAGHFKTGADGRFTLRHRAPRQWIYTASLPGRATVSVIAQVAPKMPEVRLVMPPAKPLVIRITDAAGRPLPGVDVRIYPYRTEGQLLDWTGETDAQGQVVWTNAPTQPVMFVASCKAPVMYREFKAQAGAGAKTVVLTPNSSRLARIQVRAFDIKTREPVVIKSVAAEYNGVFSFKTLAEPDSTHCTVEIRQSDFRVGMGASYKLRVEADGYDPFITDYIDVAEGDRVLEAAMVTNAMPENTALLPDGNRAAGARIWVRATRNSGSLFINQPNRYYGDRLEKSQADDRGRFKIQGAADDAPVVITSPDGFLSTTVAELKRQRKVRLQAYGTVEGRLLVAGKPKGGFNLSLASLVSSPYAGFQFSYTAVTGPDGHFAFTQVPPGQCKLYRWNMPNTRNRYGGQRITETYQMPVTVRPGETLRVEYASHGRPVVGRLVAEKSYLDVDWSKDVQVLELKQTTLPAVNREDFASNEAFAKAYQASFESPERMKQAREARTYPLDFESDGSFRVEDVPPGTYELRIHVSRPQPKGRPNPFPRPEDYLGSLTREVVVPPGKEFFDLGTIKVPVKDDGIMTEKRAVPDLVMQTLAGRPERLANYRGKYVLLVFWAAWSDRCTEQLSQLNKIESDFGQDNRLVILGVNLDNDLAAARRAVDERSYTWSQAWLDPAGRAKATAAFDVSSLPSMFLIDPEGRVVTRDLSSDRLRPDIQRVLAKK